MSAGEMGRPAGRSDRSAGAPGHRPPEEGKRPAGPDVAAAQTTLSKQRPVQPEPVPGPAGFHGAWWQELKGLSLDHYRITGRIAVGGMGAVFRAQDVRLKRNVALKVLPADQSQDPDIVRRFYQEAQAAAQLDHENIARVYHIGQDRGLHYIAFEFVEGTNVRDMIAERGRLSVAEAVDYAIQVARALHHAGSRGVVHRDIKPSNLIVTPRGRVKLVDMGLARHFERRKDSELTQTGVTMGTFDYISPEQARDPRTADVRSDIYSLGCTLYHMLTGQPPFPHGTVLQKLLQHQSESPPDPRQLNPELPDGLARVVGRMIAKRPEDRYQTAEELLRALREQERQVRGTRPGSDGDSSSERAGGLSLANLPWWERHIVWAGPSVALVVTVLLLYGGRGGAPPRPEMPGDTETASRTASGLPPAAWPTAGQPKPAPAGSEAKPASPAQRTKEPGAAQPAVFQVGPGDDLRSVCESAPSGSTVELVASGPAEAYQPAATRRNNEQKAIRLRHQQLTVRAAPKARPVIQLTWGGSSSGGGDWSLFEMIDSDVTFQGIEFILDVGAGEEAMQAFVVHGGRLALTDCTITQRKKATAQNRVTAIEALAGSPVALDLSRCFLRGGKHAIEISQTGGTVRLRDCVLADYWRPIVAAAGEGQPALEITMQNVTGLAGDEPFFDLKCPAVSLELTQCIFSRTEEGSEALVVTANVEALKRRWKASRNLYHGFMALLAQWNGQQRVPVAANLAQLREVLADRDTETDSVLGDPKFQGANRDEDGNWPIVAFRLQPTSPVAGKGVGSTLPAGPPAPAEKPSPGPEAAGRSGPSPPGPTSPSGPSPRPDSPPAEPRPEGPKPGSPPGPVEPPPGPAAGGAVPPTGPRELIVDPSGAKGYTSLNAACADARSGERIRIRHNGLLQDVAITIVDKELTLTAEPGFKPVVRITDAGLLPGDDNDAQLFRVVGGVLRLQGLELELHLAADSPALAWAFFRADDAQVELADCQVTVQAPVAVNPALVEINRRTDHASTSSGLPAGARVRLRGCFIRGIGDVVRLADQSAAEVGIDRCAVLARGVVIRSLGSSAMPGPADRLRADLLQSTLVVGTGLVAIGADDPTRHLVPMAVRIRSCVCAESREGGAALVIGRAWRQQPSLADLLSWQSEHNVYAWNGPYARFYVEASESPSRLWDRKEWLAHWSGGTDEPITDRFISDAGFLGGPVDLAAAAQRTRESLQRRPEPVEEPASPGTPEPAGMRLPAPAGDEPIRKRLPPVLPEAPEPPSKPEDADPPEPSSGEPAPPR